MIHVDGALPEESRGIFSDLRGYVFARPAVPTRIDFPTIRERVDYGKRILQRLAVDIDRFTVLNIHRIGIDAPVRYVFEELLSEDMLSRCWPGHLVTQRPADKDGQEIRFVPFGHLRRSARALFRLKLIRAQRRPDPADHDNARYLLYSCDGGYPVGLAGLYARSTLPDRGEHGQAQFFFVVSFDFYGRRAWPGRHIVNRMWEGVHDRVTVNMLNRFKRLCEGRFREVRATFEAALSENRNT